MKYQDVRFLAGDQIDGGVELLFVSPPFLLWITRDQADAADTKPIEIDDVAVQQVEAGLAFEAPALALGAEAIMVAGDAGDPSILRRERQPDVANVPRGAPFVAAGSGVVITSEQDARVLDRCDGTLVGELRVDLRDDLAEQNGFAGEPHVGSHAL